MPNLADKLIANKGKKQAPATVEVEDLPALILQNHPAIYVYRNTLYHEHTPIRYKDIDKIYQLVDRHDIRLNAPKAIWVYNRLREIAPRLEDRYILVSTKYLWDKEWARLVPVSKFPAVVTQSDTTTKKLQQSQGEEDGRMGQNTLAETD